MTGSSNTIIVVGASRGLGRGIATALARSGSSVVAVARSADAIAELANEVDGIKAEVADARDAAAARGLLDSYETDAVVLVAGATPTLHRVHEHTWESFSANWETDVRVTFHWVSEVLRKPLRPGSRVIVFSSGAALQGSPISGGYAGAKGTQRFIARYAQDESSRAGFGITFSTLLPKLTPLTDLGRPAVAAYAARGGLSETEYLEQLGAPLTPEIAGTAVLEVLNTDAGIVAAEYLLTGDGLRPLPAS
ncbi:MAG TPA: SDR family oxidoreductase [Micromonosporaceae bacterium]|jgi:NAD(P)-dependent dehydrogenase (short-subunit alcohol dehydrogenase family)